MQHVQDNVKTAVLVGASVFLTVYGLQFVWTTVSTILEDHKSLLARIRVLHNANQVHKEPASPVLPVRPKAYVSGVDPLLGYYSFLPTPFKLKVVIRNGSSEVTASGIISEAVLVQAGLGTRVEEQEFDKFWTHARKNSTVGRDLGPGQDYTVLTNALLADWKAVKDGTRPVYLIAAVWYVGDLKPLSETCSAFYGDTPILGDVVSIKHDCRNHNR